MLACIVEAEWDVRPLTKQSFHAHTFDGRLKALAIGACINIEQSHLRCLHAAILLVDVSA